MRVQRALHHLLIGLWFAIATGTVEALIALFQRYVLGQLMFFSISTLWVAPVAYVAIYALPALGLAAVGAIAPRFPRRATVFLFAFVSVVSLTLPFEQIHRLAVAIIALGGAVQLMRVFGADPDRRLRGMRRSLVPAVAAVAVAGLSLTVGSEWRKDRAIASLPDAEPGAPNILLIVLDCVRAMNLGAYGYERATSPNLDALAAEGAVFEWFIASSPWSLPSHASLFTGTHPHEQSGNFMVRFDGTHPTLAEQLAGAGYVSAGFSGNLHYGSRDVGLGRGFHHYEDYVELEEGLLLHSWLGQMALVRDLAAVRSVSDLLEIVRDPNFHVPHRRDSREKDAEVMTADFLEWLPRADGRPFFAFINYYDPHYPYHPHAGTDWLPENRSDALETPDIDRYDAEIRYVDEHLGALFRDLRDRGLLDNTIVAITADHGEALGRHGAEAHGSSLYLEQIQVPLILRHPATVPAGTRVDAITGMRDLPATLQDLAGLTPTLPGHSFAAALSGNASDGDALVLAEFSTNRYRLGTVLDQPKETRALFTDSLHYIRGDGFEELYAYRRDTLETQNLIESPDHAQAVAEFRTRLLDWFTYPDEGQSSVVGDSR